MTSMDDLTGGNAVAKRTLTYKDDVAKALKQCNGEEEEKELRGSIFKQMSSLPSADKDTANAAMLSRSISRTSNIALIDTDGTVIETNSSQCSPEVTPEKRREGHAKALQNDFAYMNFFDEQLLANSFDATTNATVGHHAVTLSARSETEEERSMRLQV